MRSALTFCLLWTAFFASAQQYGYVYYFNEALLPVAKSDALIIGHGFKTDSSVTVNFFNTTGRKLFTTEFTDSALSYMTGRYVEYDAKGRPVLLNHYKNNILNGPTQKWNTDGRLTDSIVYKDGTMLCKAKYTYNVEGKLIGYKFTDSVNNTIRVIDFDNAQNKSSEVIFNGDKGIWNYYNGNEIYKTDSVFTREEKKASFSSGSSAWLNHVQRHLDASVPIRRGAPPGNYTVIIQFIVDTTGELSDIKPRTNLGFGMEEEAMRVIKKSSRWQSAERFGKKVKDYHFQPLTFRVISN